MWPRSYVWAFFLSGLLLPKCRLSIFIFIYYAGVVTAQTAVWISLAGKAALINLTWDICPLGCLHLCPCDQMAFCPLSGGPASVVTALRIFCILFFPYKNKLTPRHTEREMCLWAILDESHWEEYYLSQGISKKDNLKCQIWMMLLGSNIQPLAFVPSQCEKQSEHSQGCLLIPGSRRLTPWLRGLILMGLAQV